MYWKVSTLVLVLQQINILLTDHVNGVKGSDNLPIAEYFGLQLQRFSLNYYQMAALVLAGFPTTKTLMLFFETWSMAPPWTYVKSES